MCSASAEAAPAARSDDEALGLRPGSRFLKYDVVRLCGRGGHALVYEGFDPFLDRRVAIKLIARGRERTATRADEIAWRAQLEARLLCRLAHPNLVRVLDAGVSEHGVFLVMEWLDGESLRATLQRLRSLRVSEALDVASQIAAGLESAHAERVVHRDLKPENVMVLAGNHAKVLDFGIAKFLNGDGPITEKDIYVGTLRYMSPEQLLGHAATAQSDVYALGTLIYELTAGRAPCYVGVDESSLGVRELVAVQLTRVPPPLDRLNPAVPPQFARLVERMLEKDPARRLPSMRAVCAELHSFGREWQPSAASSARELLAPNAEPSPELPPLAVESGSGVERRDRARRNPGRGSVSRRVLGAGALVALGLGAVALGRPSNEPESARAARMPALSSSAVAAARTTAPLTLLPTSAASQVALAASAAELPSKPSPLQAAPATKLPSKPLPRAALRRRVVPALPRSGLD